MKKFPDIRTFSWKSQKTQQWNTVTKRSGSGRVRTMTTWRYPQWTITTQFAYLTPAQYKTIMGFFASLKGAYEPFLWLDPEDNCERGVQLGHGRGGRFQAVRRWGSYLEPVEYVEDVTVYADGKVVPARFENGEIRLANAVVADAVITADYTYYWRVMLADDKFAAEAVFRDFYKSKSIKLVTCR